MRPAAPDRGCSAGLKNKGARDGLQESSMAQTEPGEKEQRKSDKIRQHYIGKLSGTSLCANVVNATRAD